MGVNIDSYAGWGLCLDANLLAEFRGGNEELTAIVESFDVEGFTAVLCGDHYTEHLTNLIIMSADNNQARDFAPVYTWLHSEFAVSFNEKLPSIVGGWIRM